MKTKLSFTWILVLLSCLLGAASEPFSTSGVVQANFTNGVAAPFSNPGGAPSYYTYGDIKYTYVPVGGAEYSDVRQGARYLIDIRVNETKSIIVENISLTEVVFDVQYSKQKLVPGQTVFLDVNKNGVKDIELFLIDIDFPKITLIIKNWEKQDAATDFLAFITQNESVFFILGVIIVLGLYSSHKEDKRRQYRT